MINNKNGNLAMRAILSMLLIVVSSLILLAGCGSSRQNATKQHKKVADAAEVNVKLGLGYLNANQPSRAKKKLLKAMALEPRSSQVNDAMAYFLESTGDKEEAEKYYKRAIELSSSSGAPLNNYGAFLCRQGKYKMAEKYFKLAIADKDYLNRADAYENAGLCVVQIPNYRKAEHYFKKALEQDDQRPNSLVELAEIHFLRKDYKNTKRYLQEFNKVASPTAQSLYLQYRVATRLNNQEQAREHLAELNKNFPASGQAKLTQLRRGHQVA
jgi:type IV pilus assembly protein PilF